MTYIEPIIHHAAAGAAGHRASAAFAFEEFAALRDLPLGKIVSTLARFRSLESLLPPEST